MDDSKDLLSIGEMAKLCRIPVKTLRYLDKKGTVKPAYVDPATQYRYYSKIQLPFIMIVKELRALGHSLNDIQKFSQIVDVEEKNIVLVDEKLAKIAKQMEKLEKARQQHLAYKAFFEYLKNIQYDNIAVKYIPSRTVLFTRSRSKYELFAVHVRYTELNHLMHENNLYHKGPLMAVYHDDYLDFNPADADIEVAIEVLPQKPVNYSIIKEIPAGLYASVIHKGRFETLMTEVYPVLYSWIKEHNYQAAGMAIQLYLWYAPMGQIPENLITEVQIPVKISE